MGSGSKLHDLLGDLMIIDLTSSGVTCLNEFKINGEGSRDGEPMS